MHLVSCIKMGIVSFGLGCTYREVIYKSLLLKKAVFQMNIHDH